MEVRKMQFYYNEEISNKEKTSKVENGNLPCFLKLRFMNQIDEFGNPKILSIEIDGHAVQV